MNYFASPHTWIVVLATLIAVSLCVAVHFKLLSVSRRYLTLISRRRRRVLLFIIAVLVAHTIEIWIFGIGYYASVVWLGPSSLHGLESASFPDYVYYSAMVYTTVGFGDIVPVGAIRFMTGVEGVTGLVMITWSASYTFIEMQRDWPQDRS